MELLQNGEWVNNRRQTYTYDKDDNLVTWLAERWSVYKWLETVLYFSFEDPYGNIFGQPVTYGAYKVEITWSTFTSVEDEPGDSFSVASFPNPFSGSTTIEYTLDKPAVVRINIYDNLGNIITTLKDKYTDIGSHSDVFNADKLPSGMYYYTIQIDKQIEKGKLLLIR